MERHRLRQPDSATPSARYGAALRPLSALRPRGSTWRGPRSGTPLRCRDAPRSVVRSRDDGSIVPLSELPTDEDSHVGLVDEHGRFMAEAAARGGDMTERTLEVNGVELCTEPFGEPNDPPVLLVMGLGASMLWWDEGFCRMLAD